MASAYSLPQLRNHSTSAAAARISPRSSQNALKASQSPPPPSGSSSSSSYARRPSPASPRSATPRQTRTKGRSSSRGPTSSAASESGYKENVPLDMQEEYVDGEASRVSRSGKQSRLSSEPPREMGNGGGRTWRDGSLEIEDDAIRARKSHSVRSSKSPVPSSPGSPAYNGLPTLPTIPDPDEDTGDAIPSSSSITSRPPPPAASTQTASGRPLQRKRRSSSIKRKPSPGVTPKNVVDWEIPRKTLHSSIGFLTLGLYYLDPKDLTLLLTVLSTGLISVFTIDLARLRFPVFAEHWESIVGFLMREQERSRINGVVWYLMGVITVLAVYPRDVAVISILTLSWSDTTASTIGRLWGKYTPPLPSHFPGVQQLRFAPRKSLAGFLAATVTGILICLGFWWHGSQGRWLLLDGTWPGLLSTAVIVGIGGAIAEAMDLGLDDNLTLPIISGAMAWAWLGATNLLLK